MLADNQWRRHSELQGEIDDHRRKQGNNSWND